MRSMFSLVRRSWYLMTLTSGFRSLRVCSALSTFGVPIRDVACRICRCRFEASTTSASTRPSVPTPAAAS
jgi:hypothetical protein